MSLTVELRDAKGNVIRRIVEGANDLTKLMPPMDDPDFPMLGLLDPYGDTFFSGTQMRRVIPELRKLRDLTLHPPPVLDELDDLASECAEGVHRFLVFVGD